jgi:cephalosporin hydroxylase
MDPIEQFFAEMKDRIQAMGGDEAFRQLSIRWMQEATRLKYTYNFTWMGRPAIQLPQDIMAMQELIWEVKPDLIIETGIAHGGSLVFNASILELIGNPKARVLGIDIDIRPHNRAAIEAHPMKKRIDMIQGSSISSETLDAVHTYAKDFTRPLVILDSNHTHAHVLEELRLYAPFVKHGSYLVVMDTAVEWVSKELAGDRPWGPGDNPMTAMDAYLKESDRFVIDHGISDKLGITVAPRGFLKCVKDRS